MNTVTEPMIDGAMAACEDAEDGFREALEADTPAAQHEAIDAARRALDGLMALSCYQAYRECYRATEAAAGAYAGGSTRALRDQRSEAGQAAFEAAREGITRQIVVSTLRALGADPRALEGFWCWSECLGAMERGSTETAFANLLKAGEVKVSYTWADAHESAIRALVELGAELDTEDTACAVLRVPACELR